jgi:type 1 glutamine amidotransferase
MKCFCLLALGLSTLTSPLLAAAPKPHVVFLINEDEYAANRTLPAFARLLEEKCGCRTTVLDGQGKHEIRGLEALDSADLMVLFARRKGLPKDQMQRVRKYLDAGKPLVALRTASHAFALNKNSPGTTGVEQWPTFDVDVLGCRYHGHGPNEKGTEVAPGPDAAKHPILKGVEPLKWHSTGSLYYVLPLDNKATVLLSGSIEKQTEPIAWIRNYKDGRVFYTSLGHPEDFEQPQFRLMLVNAVLWALGPAPKQPNRP